MSRWMKTRDNNPEPQARKWRDNDWLLVDGRKVLARTYAFHHDTQTGRWLWALSAWDGDTGVTDTFEEAKAAVKARLEALRKAKRREWLLSRKINCSKNRMRGRSAEQTATSGSSHDLEPPLEAGCERDVDRRLNPTLAVPVSTALPNE